MSDLIERLDKAVGLIDNSNVFLRESNRRVAGDDLVRAWPGIARALRAAEEYQREQASPSKDYTLIRVRREQLFDALDALKEAK